VLARRFNAFFGPRQAVLCISVLATVIGLVTWFAVGLLLLLPIMFTLARESRRPVMLLAIPMLTFLSVMHGLTPPHPGPVVAIDALGADIGMTLLLGFLVGIPTAVIAGPLFARWIVPLLPEGTGTPVIADETVHRVTPGFRTTVVVVALPIALLLLSTFTGLVLAPGTALYSTLMFIGHPVVALTVAVLLAMWIFGRACGFNRPQILVFSEQSVAAIGMVLLVVGGGDHHRGRAAGTAGGGQPGDQPRAARALHGLRLALPVAPERQRVLAGQGGAGPHRRTDIQDLDGAGNHHRTRGARLHARPRAGRLIWMRTSMRRGR
jgi:gluconate:H+ symporter, GntP family